MCPGKKGPEAENTETIVVVHDERIAHEIQAHFQVSNIVFNLPSATTMSSQVLQIGILVPVLNMETCSLLCHDFIN